MVLNSENNDAAVIGRNLISLRRSMALSQADIGAVLGLSYQQVQKYERGYNRLPIEHLQALKQFYNVPYDAFFESVPDNLAAQRLSSPMHNREAEVYFRMRTLKNNRLKEKIYKVLLVLLEN
jgi:transcriptional regulator with XRE-family HTH domain